MLTVGDKIDLLVLVQWRLRSSVWYDRDCPVTKKALRGIRDRLKAEIDAAR